MEYRNPPTVVVGLIPIFYDHVDGLLTVRRGLSDGYGKLALPGGYQNEGETWQDALSREVLEETGYDIDPYDWKPVNVVTVQKGKINLLFAVCEYSTLVSDKTFDTHWTDADGEILGLEIIYKPTELAFPAHTDEARAWFQRRSLI